MNAERVPKHGKAEAAFAGAQLSDAWLAIMSIFAALVVGSIFGWVAYVGIPMLGYFTTKAYIDWKSRNLPGHVGVVLYRYGLFGGYSRAFDRKKKLFVGDSKVANPNALQMGAIVRAQANEDAVAAPEASPANESEVEMVN
jgi:ABC-type amino acid transport system permease subunit